MSKAEGLFTPAELKEREAALTRLENSRTRDNFTEYWAQRKALEAAQLREKIVRIQARAEEYLGALLVVAGSRGQQIILLDHVFRGDPQVSALMEKHDNPEARRTLYTMLRGLSEVPSSYAMSAFIRFLRGVGKQKKDRYHGAGAFGSAYGWTEREVMAVASILTDRCDPYSKVLMSYADAAAEIAEEDPDYELVSYQDTFRAARTIRDKEFILKLCGILEQRGLADVPAPAPEKPKKERIPKVFKSGDIIRKRNLRDLECPAHIRVTLEREGKKKGEWLKFTQERVVMDIAGGYYTFYIVQDGVAYPPDRLEGLESKRRLDGAVYLGPWSGKVDGSKKMKLNFYFRYPAEG